MVSEMADLTRNNLFPTAEAIAALGLQFSMPPDFDMEEGEGCSRDCASLQGV